MRKILVVASCLILIATAKAQTGSRASAAKNKSSQADNTTIQSDVKSTPAGTLFGTITNNYAPISAAAVGKYLANNMNPTLVTGTVTEVSQVAGNWVLLQTNGGQPLMIKTDAFAFPKDIVGKTITAQGTATVKEVSEDLRKEYAQSTGAIQEEMKRIIASGKLVIFSATAVKVL
ncbi:MAG: DUF4920 domain-containing protein [Chitinophagales bacterium]